MNKDNKTNVELSEMVVAEMQKHPAFTGLCGSIVEVSRQQPYQPNWDVIWGRTGARSHSVDDAARVVVSPLQGKFDLTYWEMR